MNDPCVAPRKDGQPCRAVGRWFDPARQGLVCDAHASPEINEKFQRRAGIGAEGTSGLSRSRGRRAAFGRGCAPKAAAATKEGQEATPMTEDR
jgi:hypothetical protein